MTPLEYAIKHRLSYEAELTAYNHSHAEWQLRITWPPAAPVTMLWYRSTYCLDYYPAYRQLPGGLHMAPPTGFYRATPPADVRRSVYAAQSTDQIHDVLRLANLIAVPQPPPFLDTLWMIGWRELALNLSQRDYATWLVYKDMADEPEAKQAFDYEVDISDRLKAALSDEAYRELVGLGLEDFTPA